MDVAKCFNIRRLTEGDLGIEVEVEGSSLPTFAVNKYWKREYDGSLQGESMEYVLRAPLGVTGVKLALNDLTAQYKKYGTKVSDSVRAGVHVHVNMQKLSIPHLYNFITLYSMFEPVLMDYCGKGRTGNLFCLPLNKSPLLINAICHAAETEDFSILHSDRYRYCAMNVKALGTYGSVEFRALRSGRNLNRVYRWASLLLSLREVACYFDNPTQIIEQASITGYTEFFWQTLGKHKAMFKNTQNVDKKLRKGIECSLPIVYSGDWDELAKEPDPYRNFY